MPSVKEMQMLIAAANLTQHYQCVECDVPLNAFGRAPQSPERLWSCKACNVKGATIAVVYKHHERGQAS